MQSEQSAGDGVLIVLCTFNELGNLPKLFDGLLSAMPRADILVVDDNSPDGTADWVRQQMLMSDQVTLLAREGKMGLGTALRDAIRWCLERDYQYLVNLDADLSHNPEDVPKLHRVCLQKNVDVVIGSRYVTGGSSEGLSTRRRIISRALNSYATRLLKLPVSDCSGSFRCYKTEMLAKLQLEQLTCRGYGFLEEVLFELRKLGARFAEVAIRFDDRNAGESKLTMADAVGALKTIHRLALKRNGRS